MARPHVNQAGFGHVAIVFVLLFVAVAGFAGYKVVTSNGSQKASVATSVPVRTVASTAAPVQIKSKADLVQTAKALDSTSGQVNGSLNDGTLNQDLNDML